MYQQIFDPLNNIGLSALVAAVPIVFFFIALVGLKMKAYLAGFFTTAIAIGLGAYVYGMPVSLGVGSAVYGALYGLFPIGWIVLMAVFLYNITLHTGQFEVIKQSISSITDDRRLQVLLISFCFGSFLEGAAGFGTPVAITAAILIGLGFDSKYAACMCLLANTAPVAFGGLGIPVLVGAQVTGLDTDIVSKQLAMIIPLLGIVVPFYLIAVMSGLKGMLEIWPAIAVCSASFTLTMWATAYFMGPILPDVLAAVVSMVCLTLFLKVWKPKKVWRFENDTPIQTSESGLTLKSLVYAWSPFVILIIFIGNWGVDSVKSLLDAVTIGFNIPVVTNSIINPDTGKAVSFLFKLNWLSAAGTAILFAAICAAVVARMSVKDFFSVFGKTLNSLKWSLVTIAFVLAYAYVGNSTGMTTTLGTAVSATGPLFPLFASIVGWIGVFVTGSDTSANALFGKLQTTAFTNVNSMPVLGMGANLAGGGVGKMISPQSIAIAAAATGLVGREGELYKFALRHSIVLLVIMCIWVYLVHTGAGGEGLFSFFAIREAGTGFVETGADTSLGTGLTIMGISLAVIILLGAWVNSGRKA